MIISLYLRNIWSFKKNKGIAIRTYVCYNVGRKLHQKRYARYYIT